MKASLAVLKASLAGSGRFRTCFSSAAAASERYPICWTPLLPQPSGPFCHCPGPPAIPSRARPFPAPRVHAQSDDCPDWHENVVLDMAESEGFEPPIRCRIPDFESGAFDHSANSPRTADYTDFHVEPLPRPARLAARSGQKNGGREPPPRNGRSSRPCRRSISSPLPPARLWRRAPRPSPVPPP